MKKPLLILSFLFLSLSSIFACGGLTQQAQSGEIRYSLSSSDPLSVDITATMYFDIYEGLASDSIFIDWGDGSITTIFATSISSDTAEPVDVTIQPLYQHIYQGHHRYDSIPASGYYYVTAISQFRPSSVSNIGNGQTSNLPFYIEALFFPGLGGDMGNHATIVSVPQIIFGNVYTPLYITPTYNDPDGDSITFDLITPLLAHNSPVPLYSSPDSFCNYYAANSSTFAINRQTGTIVWPSPCYQGLFTFATRVSKYRNGVLMGSFVRDQNIYIGDAVAATATTDLSLSNNLQIFPNPAVNTLSGNISGADLVEGSFAKIITVDGKQVTNNIPLKTGHFEVDISILPAGLYLVQTTIAGHSYTQRFVKATD